MKGEKLMRIFNQDKMQELTEYDQDLGQLIEDKLLIAHHEAREAVPEEGHYETTKEYPNGGKDVRWVVDVPAVEACEAYDEYEDILVYVPYSERELALIEISKLKAQLCATDYMAIKYAEGVLSAEEYAETRAKRQSMRERINELEVLI